MLEFSGRSRAVVPPGLPTRVGPVKTKVKSAAAGALREVVRGADGPKSLGRLLRDRGLLTETQLEAAIARQQHTGGRLGHVLVELGFVTAEAVLEAPTPFRRFRKRLRAVTRRFRSGRWAQR